MSSKPPLLFLCHRIPFPPNKGDKIRSWHLLAYLAEFFTVYLATFVDDPADHVHEEKVREQCAEALFMPLQPGMARVRSAKGLITGDALSIPYYHNKRMQRWVDDVVEQHGITRALVFCSPMAQYVLPGTRAGDALDCKVLDLVDVDSDKWRQYASSQPWPLSWVYGREGERLLAFERTAVMQCRASFLVSSREAALFRQLAPECGDRVQHFNNGVDDRYFSPKVVTANPYTAAQRQALVFTGAMDYWPNVDAVSWFASAALPLIRAAHPGVSFHIVGSHPTREVQELTRLDGVHVTGRVPDVRPYLQHSLAAVAPLRIARGIQNKVLEAMAMAKPVLVSPMGLEGIEAHHGETVLCCKTPPDYVAAVKALIEGEHAEIGTRARGLVEHDFNWSRNLAPVLEALMPHGQNDSGAANAGSSEQSHLNHT